MSEIKDGCIYTVNIQPGASNFVKPQYLMFGLNFGFCKGCVTGTPPSDMEARSFECTLQFPNKFHLSYQINKWRHCDRTCS